MFPLLSYSSLAVLDEDSIVAAKKGVVLEIRSLQAQPQVVKYESIGNDDVREVRATPGYIALYTTRQLVIYLRGTTPPYFTLPYPPATLIQGGFIANDRLLQSVSTSTINTINAGDT